MRNKFDHILRNIHGNKICVSLYTSNVEQWGGGFVQIFFLQNHLGGFLHNAHFIGRKFLG